MHTEFWLENIKVRNLFANVGVCEFLILKWNLKKERGSMNWIHLAQGWNQWRDLVNTVMSLRVA